jgi:hypothetical protein
MKAENEWITEYFDTSADFLIPWHKGRNYNGANQDKVSGLFRENRGMTLIRRFRVVFVSYPNGFLVIVCGCF